MKKPQILYVALIVFGLGLGRALARPAEATPLVGTAAAAGATEYTVDPVHSAVVFRTKHMGVSYSYGRFNRFEGVVHFDEAQPANSSVEVAIQADSIDTNSQQRDNHLRSPDFLSAKEFPLINFKSTKVEKKGKSYLVTGELTLRSTTKPVTAEVEFVGKAATEQGEKAGFEAVFEIDPRDYGFTWMTQREGAVGPIVRLTVSLECVKA